jgi:hypothetical protein
MERIDSIATLPGVLPQKVRRAQYADIPFREYVFAWSARVAWGAGLSGGSATMFILLMLRWPIANALAPTLASSLCIGGAAFVWALRLRADWYDEVNQSEEVTFTERRNVAQAVRDPHKVELDLDNGRGAVVVWQPAPGAFARWLHEVTNDGKYFSQAQALSRGWTVEQHNQLVHQLRSIGLIHPTQTERNAPVMTNHGAELAKKWLRMGV